VSARSEAGDAPAAAPHASADELQVRRYRTGDESAIIDLFERTFGRPMGESESPRHWRWEFMENPSGKEAILLAWSGDRLAAQYAVLPLRFLVDGTIHDAALSLDTATDAPFRGRGLFPRIARQLYAELASEGYVAVFGFPNAMSAPTFFHKLGWVELAPFPLLLKPLPGGVGRALRRRGGVARALGPLGEIGARIVWRSGGPSLPNDFAMEEVSSYPQDTDEFWERARIGKRACVVRDRRYLEWRYRCNPDHPYQSWVMRERGTMVGTLVTRVAERFGMRCGFIMDLLCEESRPDVARALVQSAETSLVSGGAEMLSALMYPGSVANRALRNRGFWRIPSRWFPQPIHFGVCVLSPEREPPRLLVPDHWFITWGDSDVV
jgi:hypothetical protein